MGDWGWVSTYSTTPTHVCIHTHTEHDLPPPPLVQRQVVNRPLAGTRRRGATREEDAALEAELLADEKERAEHVMLVDLGRNDVGKVAKAGSVRVEKLMEIERYSHVMHISSTVSEGDDDVARGIVMTWHLG